MTVTSPVAFGKSALILAGDRGNCTIKVGSADARTLTVGASCVPKEGVRSASGDVGKPGPPVVVLGVPVGLLEDGLDEVQAVMSRPTSTTATCTHLRLKMLCRNMSLLLSYARILARFARRSWLAARRAAVDCHHQKSCL